VATASSNDLLRWEPRRLSESGGAAAETTVRTSEGMGSDTADATFSSNRPSYPEARINSTVA
jgi:hypothetical protein